MRSTTSAHPAPHPGPSSPDRLPSRRRTRGPEPRSSRPRDRGPLADDLDWNAIIATGNDAERRERTGTPTDGSGQSSGHAPLSRRAARAARERQEAASAATQRDQPTAAPAEQSAGEPGRPGPRRSVGTAPAGDDVHPDVHALLGGTLHSGHVPAAAGRGTRDEADDETPVRRRGTWQGVGADDGVAPAARTVAAAPVGSTGTGSGATDDDASGADGSGGDGPRGGAGRGGAGGDDGGRRGGRGGASRPPRDDRPARRKGPLIAGIVIVALVLAAAGGAYAFAAPKVQAVMSAISGAKETDDYTGDGTSKVTITIKEGDIGEDVAATLQRSGVVKTSSAFYELLLASPEVQFQPGSYALKKKMSSKAALSALQDKANRVEDPSLVIPEGTALQDIEAGMVSKAGLSKAEVAAAAEDVSAYGLPAGVTTLEGWLFPATYPIKPDWTAKQYFQAMVDTMKQRLEKAGVAEADQERVVVFASLVQKEAGLAADYPKVARVFQNRLDDGMRLQSDATVAYGTGNTHTVTTTDAERADASNEYNTYQHDGLPPAPISNPGDIAIDAVVHQATGNWLYFVTVDLETGETVFSDTYDQHLVAVERFRSWLRAHPEYQ
ncbi:endolytic transglycosylase MltG [Curtobacterium sp. MCJR17_055]|nr:endolytic transglycosylase MltG [Curtobacterium sp. MCBD17_029]PYY55545.1 endolytic transglycosylase MltG [Curtobacterium sp. MCJR17_055]PYY60291.1 endolytic transglycosylase MltG [Curtobacterium sp. MCPF17_015]